MKPMAVCLGMALFSVSVLPVAAGQDGNEVLTNADIVTLTEVDLPPAVIVVKIAATRTAFETSVANIVALSRAGVDAEVIEAMITTGRAADLRSIDFGDDSSQWAEDGECDDPRFEGDGMATTLLDEDRGHDATDCRQLFDSGRIRHRSIDFGDDSSQWAEDGECDDPRFEGDGMATTLLDEDRGHDATDCRQLFDSGRVRLRGVD